LSIKEELLDENTTRILQKTKKLLSEGEITEEQAGEVNKLARENMWLEAADQLEEYKEQEEEDPLDEIFEEEEKQLFAERFAESFQELQDSVSEMRQELHILQSGTSRGELITFLRGKKSSRTKKEVKAVFSAIDSFQAGGTDLSNMAKVLAAYTSELNISETEELLKEIQEKAEEAEA